MKAAKTAAICGIASLALAAAGLAGCGDTVDGTKTALVINDEEINVGTANFYLRHQQAETANMMQNYGMSTSDMMWDQTISDSQTYGESLKSNCQDSLVEMVLLRQHAEEYNVSLTDEETQKIDEAAQQVADANQDALKRIGATKDDVAQVLELYTYQQKMREPMIADTDREVSDEEAAQTTVTYARASLKGDDDAALTDDEKAALKTEGEEILAQVKGSADPASADFSTIASSVGDDFTVSSPSYGSDDTIVEDAVKNAVAGMSDGQVYDGVLETDDYYYVLRLDHTFDPEATESEKESIITERENENYDSKLQGWMDASTVKTEPAWEDIRVTDKDIYIVKPEDTSSESGTDSSSGSTGSSSGSTDSSSGSTGSSSGNADSSTGSSAEAGE